MAGVSSFIALGLLAEGYWVLRLYQAYRTLCEVSCERRGIRRAQTMTPREYRAALERAALPNGPLARLTALFEKARYGREKLGQEDEQVATAALRSILQEIELT
ncbi:MAG TPA: DUF4129 domain-containing protein [Anaerolineales bacterium]|nr:DUF4129 domain-containing protein [Anaerolineales bacterium]